MNKKHYKDSQNQYRTRKKVYKKYKSDDRNIIGKSFIQVTNEREEFEELSKNIKNICL